MNWLDLALWTILAFCLKHAVILVIPVVIVLAAFFPVAALAFVRSPVGHVVIAGIVAATIGWELRGYVEGADAIRASLSAERQKVQDAERLRDQAEKQREVAADQAKALRRASIEASTREANARQTADDLQEQVDDYAEELADARKHPAADRQRFVLSAADVRGLRGIGAGSRRKHP